MKELLLADANRLSASLSEYEANRHRIESAEYETFTLSEADFYDLVFMEANDSVWANNQKLVDILTPEGKSRTLKLRYLTRIRLERAEMLDSLKDKLPLINLVLNFVGLIGVPTLIVLGILRPYPNAKTRMKKKILQKLTDEANKDHLLFPELRLRDYLLFRRILVKRGFFLENFYTVFIESIRELETKNEIICISNSEFGITAKDTEEEYPSYSSKAKKTPVDYHLKKDNPRFYVGLNSQETQDFIEGEKRYWGNRAEQEFGAYD